MECISMFTLPSPFLSEALTHTLQPVRPAPSVLARTWARVEAGGPRHVAELRQDSELVLRRLCWLIGLCGMQCFVSDCIVRLINIDFQI